MSTTTASGPARSTLAVRLAVGGLGVLVGLYGAWLLLSRQDLGQLLDVAIWLAVGVAAHDAVLAPLVLLLALATRWAAPLWRRALVVLLVVLGSTTLFAVPVLGRFGARPDNPTLLDRPYVASWLVLAAVAVALVVVAGVAGTARRRERARRD